MPHARGALLALLVGLLASGCAEQSSQDAQSESAAARSQTAATQTVALSIHGMTCQGCVDAIHGALARHEAVIRDSVSLADSSAVITFDPARIGVQDLVQAIERLGYGATPVGPEQR